MRYFDAFSGIGGFALAFNGLGHECAGYSEIDKKAIEVYQKHFPHHVNYGDITNINVHGLPDFDIFAGGFPCQSFSIAGKRGGFDDTRGTLFFEIARILRHKRPRYFLLENVKGLLSHDNGKTFGRIVAVLCELGYCVEWQVLNSKHFGVPQNRERVFIVGHFGECSGRKVFPIGENDSKDIREADKGEIVELSGNESLSARVYSPDGITPTLKGLGGGLGAKTGLYAVKSPESVKSVAIRTRSYRGQPAQIEEREDNVSKALSSVQKDYMVKVHNLQGRSENRPSVRYNKNAGGSGPLSKQDGTVYCLDTCNLQGLELPDTRIRRLTPLECERLQGFPDHWTAEGVNGKISDAQRYQMTGNAVTVNVVAYIINKLT